MGAEGRVEPEVGEGARGKDPLLRRVLFLRLRRRRRLAELPLGGHGELAAGRRAGEGFRAGEQGDPAFRLRRAFTYPCWLVF